MTKKPKSKKARPIKTWGVIYMGNLDGNLINKNKDSLIKLCLKYVWPFEGFKIVRVEIREI